MRFNLINPSTDRTDAVARCLESVKLGCKKRSSMNNIGACAREMARGIRAKYAPSTLEN